MSLLQDARIDVTLEQAASSLRHYTGRRFGSDANNADSAAFETACAIAATQRNLKIAGIFVRLAQRDAKPGYLAHLLRILTYLQQGLTNPALADMTDWLHRHAAGAQTLNPNTDVTGIETGMILAAGRGTRMQPKPDDPPKPLIEIAGQSLLARMMDRLIAARVSRIIVNVHHKAEMIETALQAYQDRVELHISDEREALLETGGGVKNALPLIGHKPFFVCNADILWQENSAALAGLAQGFDAARMMGGFCWQRARHRHWL